MRPELRGSSRPNFFRHFSAKSAESGGNCRTMVERKCNTGYNQSRYSYTTSWAVGRRFRSDRRIALMSRRCSGAKLAISERNRASALRRAAADWAIPKASTSTFFEPRPDAFFFTLMMLRGIECPDRMVANASTAYYLAGLSRAARQARQ